MRADSRLKGQHSVNSFLLRASSRSPPGRSSTACTAVLSFPHPMTEEMASPAPQDLQTSRARPPSLPALQHPGFCYKSPVQAQWAGMTIGRMSVSEQGRLAGVMCEGLHVTWRAPAFCLDECVSLPTGIWTCMKVICTMCLKINVST